ncbi:hypothetical protein L596_012204 [Steinernema carpocapsae]|uniref:G-protein coupled receptors family 1 profile domain-containing protein n=1 Tax=Steinernema carpocapsae TaxID=34508 RepID=A0A4U5NX52_STECR|nr:hypothetical protein L596_012204 [Steinernema carpocapsae]
MLYKQLNSWLYYALCFLNIPIGVVFFYIVLKKSPSTIRLYRNTLLNLGFWYYAASLEIGLLLQPVLDGLETVQCTQICGLLAYFQDNLTLVSTAHVVGGAACVNSAIALSLCFFVRYIQVAHPKIALYLNSKKGFMLATIPHLCGTICSSSFLSKFYFGNNYHRTESGLLFCADWKADLTFTIGFIVLILGLVANSVSIVVLAFLTIRTLSKNRLQMSQKTYKLQKRLTLNLILLAVLPIVLDVVPLSSALIIIYFQVSSMYFVSTIATHAQFLDVFLTCIITLIFVTPYRKAVLGWLPKRCQLF